MSVLLLRLEPSGGPVFRHEVRGESAVFGRSSKADVVLADRCLSRLHARLILREEGWFLEDLGSRNTTYLNDRPLSGPEPVRQGDVIRLAGNRVVIEKLVSGGAAEGDGLTGTVDEKLPGTTIVRSAAQLLAAEPRERGLAEALFTGRLKLLNEVHRALAGPIKLDALLGLILDSAFVHLNPEEGAIFLKRAGGGYDRAASRRAPGVTGEYLYSRRLAQEVTEKGLAALVIDASLDTRFASSESIVVSGTRSILAAPLLHSEGCLGMIVLSAKSRPQPFSEDELELLVALASAAALRIRNIALTEENARRRLLDKELQLAHDIQMAMLPRSFPVRAEVDIAAVLRPARSVGGDLYDVVDDGSHVWFMIGDVSGKGVGAALFMAVTKTLFRAIVSSATSVADVVTRMNRELARDNELAMFVTVFAARLDLATGELEYVNAGHNPTYRLTAEGGCAPLGGAPDPALGAVEEEGYRSGRLCLRRGDTLALYTDGVLEALNAHGEEFQTPRLEAYLAGCYGVPAVALVRGLVERVEEFAGDAPQYDDVTVLALRYLGPA